MRAIGILLFTLLIIISSCTQDSASENIEITQADHFIQSPIPQANIPYSDYSFDAAKGDTLFHKSGSILLFPTYSFIDKSGNVIVGKVDIRYREFSNPMDFFLSGIPMNYDSLGTNYTFESSGMCEILAYKDGNPVFVNPENQPEINMVSNNTSKSHSIYYLDTIKQNWENREVSTVTDLRDFTISNEEKTFRRALFEPIKPEKANQKSPIIEIDIDPASFKELMVYDNLKFQLDQNENSFNPKDSKDIWNKVELIRRNKKGLYTVNFINSSRRVSYSARPVLEGEDYSKALLTFERKNAEYKRKLKERITQKEANKKDYEKRKRLNDLIEIRNIEIDKKSEKMKKIYADSAKRIEEKNEFIKKRNNEILAQNKKNKLINSQRNKASKIIRNLSIDGFGIWNCDVASRLNTQMIISTFKNENGDMLDLSNLTVVSKSFNGIQRAGNSEILFVKDTESMMFSINDGKLAYFTYNDFKKLNITADTKKQTFILKTIPEADNNYEFLKKLGEN